jgi:hypothetical protein
MANSMGCAAVVEGDELVVTETAFEVVMALSLVVREIVHVAVTMAASSVGMAHAFAQVLATFSAYEVGCRVSCHRLAVRSHYS